MSNGDGDVRVATLNTWGTRADWERRRSVFRAEFKRLDADLITLQETILTRDQDQAHEMLGDGYHLVQQTEREADGQGITTASRWPIGETVEVDLHVSDRTYDFAATSLITEIRAPEPIGRIWLVNHLPDWQLDHEYKRTSQGVATARAVGQLVARLPGHVIVAGDFDAAPDSDSLRFWTGKHSVDGISVCYRDAWVATHQDDPNPLGHTFVPDNPYSADWDWPYRRIDYILLGCGPHGGPTLAVNSCTRTFDQPDTIASDHFGLAAELRLPASCTPNP
jgi:endonuclease/exonuclease/phosphatase family metal-dependent hydrolase